ncbi:MAG: tetratricopeptide repeat protein, partial [Bacteroidota bacterium]
MTERLTQLYKFLELAPDDAFTLYSIAHEYQQGGDLQKARSYFERLLEAQPTYVGAYYHLADIQKQQGEAEVAENTYRTGMKTALAQRD